MCGSHGMPHAYAQSRPQNAIYSCQSFGIRRCQPEWMRPTRSDWQRVTHGPKRQRQHTHKLVLSICLVVGIALPAYTHKHGHARARSTPLTHPSVASQLRLNIQFSPIELFNIGKACDKQPSMTTTAVVVGEWRPAERQTESEEHHSKAAKMYNTTTTWKLLLCHRRFLLGPVSIGGCCC